LDYNNGRAVFSAWDLIITSVGESVKKGLEPGGREMAIVGAVIRKRLVTDSEH
jgi:hypothetical protein